MFPGPTRNLGGAIKYPAGKTMKMYWTLYLAGFLGKMKASCDRGKKGETKETGQDIQRVMLSHCVYFI